MTTPASPWRDLGNTDRSAFVQAVARAVTGGSSPMAADAAAVYDALADAGLSRLGAAMLWIERKNDSWKAEYGLDSSYRNPFAMKDRTGGWARFDSYPAAARAWAERLLSPNGPYARTGSIAELVHVYAPAADGNSEVGYVDQIIRETDRLPVAEAAPDPVIPGGYRTVACAGIAKPLSLPAYLPFRQSLIRAGQTNQRPGIAMTPRYYTQHETANLNAGANAAMHERWLHGGASGGADQQVGFHFVVDDKEIIQLLPVNEVGWHAGDGSGPGNMQSIGCELCVNTDGNWAQARANAAELAAAVIRAHGWDPKTALRTHWSWVSGRPGAHYCPNKLLTDGTWEAFAARVAQTVAGGTAPPPARVPLVLDFTADDLKVLWPDFDPNGPVSKVWLDRAKRTGLLPPLIKVNATPGPGASWERAYWFGDGSVIYHAAGRGAWLGGAA